MGANLINKLLTISILLGLICNATFSEFFPSLRLLFLVIAIILSLYKFSTYGRSVSMISTLFLILSLIFFNSNYYIIINSHTDNAYYFAIIFGLIISDNIFTLKKYLTYIIIINFIVMIYEILNFKYFINLVAANKFELGRYQGLFAYSKETSFFLVVSFLLFRHFNTSFIFKLLLLISSIFTGSRTSMIFIGSILIIDVFFKINVKNKTKNIKYFIGIVLFLLLLIPFFQLYFKDNFVIYNRILNSFDSQSSGHLDRMYWWSRYIEYIGDYNLIEIIFGKGSFIVQRLVNGSENTWITLFSEVGLVGFLIYFIPILYLSFLSVKNSFKYYPYFLLMLLMIFGRIGLGWADGIILWALIFHIIYFSKKIDYEKNYLFNI